MVFISIWLLLPLLFSGMVALPQTHARHDVKTESQDSSGQVSERKRSDGRQSAWTLLDPNTGRPLKKPSHREIPDSPGPSPLKHFLDYRGQAQPIYKYHKRQKFGYNFSG